MRHLHHWAGLFRLFGPTLRLGVHRAGERETFGGILFVGQGEICVARGNVTRLATAMSRGRKMSHVFLFGPTWKFSTTRHAAWKTRNSLARYRDEGLPEQGKRDGVKLIL